MRSGRGYTGSSASAWVSRGADSMTGDLDQGGRQAPVLRVVHGSPSPEEIAALVAVLAARAPAEGTAAGRGALRNGWSERSRLLRAPLLRGPGGWRASGLPR